MCHRGLTGSGSDHLSPALLGARVRVETNPSTRTATQGRGRGTRGHSYSLRLGPSLPACNRSPRHSYDAQVETKTRKRTVLLAFLPYWRKHLFSFRLKFLVTLGRRGRSVETNLSCSRRTVKIFVHLVGEKFSSQAPHVKERLTTHQHRAGECRTVGSSGSDTPRTDLVEDLDSKTTPRGRPGRPVRHEPAFRPGRPGTQGRRLLTPTRLPLRQTTEVCLRLISLSLSLMWCGTSVQTLLVRQYNQQKNLKKQKSDIPCCKFVLFKHISQRSVV